MSRTPSGTTITLPAEAFMIYQRNKALASAAKVPPEPVAEPETDQRANT